jgi:hypothetical protein
MIKFLIKTDLRNYYLKSIMNAEVWNLFNIINESFNNNESLKIESDNITKSGCESFKVDNLKDKKLCFNCKKF